MKCLLAFVAVALFVCANGQFFPTKKCPAGEHSVLYCPRMAEPDCADPTVHEPEIAGACDIPDCFCDRPTVRNLKTGRCIELSKCPGKKN